jgi:N-acetylglucosaminyldiphosphoundecaprenol N-acetyl-beta-D-mannosaminyltransferase
LTPDRGFKKVFSMDDGSALQTGSFFGFRLVAAPARPFLEFVIDSAAARDRARTVGYLNAAQVNLAFDDAEHCRRLAAMDHLYADGKAVVWAARWHGAALAERINAGDFTPELMRGLAGRGLKLALVGGRPGADDRPGEAERAADRYRLWAPGLQIVLCHHGYFDPSQAPRVAEAIEATDPDLVLLGMGAPRQERWAMEWAARGRPRAWWCVGALFEYDAGARLRAPVWMRRIGLEWLVRLALEPVRLWRRYLIGNPLFVARVLRGRPPAALRGDERP